MIPLVDATDLHRVRRRLYRLGESRLWVPVAFAQGLAAMATFFVLLAVLWLLGVSIVSTSSAVVILAPTMVVFKVADREMTDGRSPGFWLVGWWRYLTAPRALVL